jgi:anti-sigma B factor antagonist
MPEDTGWAVVPLPDRISSANAEQLRKRLLWVISCGAAVLVADLTATLSCDSAGTEALLQVYQRGVASGTELRLVVTAEAVRRALRLGGLSHLVLMFPTPAAALADMRQSGRQPSQALKIAVPRDLPGAGEPGRAPAADPALLDSVVHSIFEVAVSLQGAAGLPRDRIVRCITECLDQLDDAVRDIREYVFAGHIQGPQSPAAAKRSAALRRQLAVTARALHTASAETAALIGQRRSLTKEPHRVDYPTSIKRWQAIADAAQQMAERYEDD